MLTWFAHHAPVRRGGPVPIIALDPLLAASLRMVAVRASVRRIGAIPAPVLPAQGLPA